jgi:hypothetical protein
MLSQLSLEGCIRFVFQVRTHEKTDGSFQILSVKAIGLSVRSASCLASSMCFQNGLFELDVHEARDGDRIEEVSLYNDGRSSTS